ncbi:cyclopropane-fatty-acyl-phospholipid synthase family protein [Rothia sp. ZJ932]|uniref:SAM-dependent methyltransferase n=1 Tax=Rothia sp. ZJ932 TaxID=2810516 RepID=UPI001966EFB8|nr:class I SAM-dependent methyltransferase [Rothia sp. ZJ932]QRZ60982.1 class I SAM-dependent methyltransferase [Rothia sp. ZJ932]
MSMHDIDPTMNPQEFWEQRYGTSDRIWSGNANAVLEKVAASLPAGRALDLGSGEGGDVLWLATQGWHATGLELSATAVSRAHEAAQRNGLADRIEFLITDLSIWQPSKHYDLVSASFLQSPVALDRAEILQRATQAVAVGGHLLITAHAAPPSGVEKDFERAMFPQPQDDLAALELAPDEWQVITADIWTRQGTHHGNPEPMTFEDSVVLVKRLA